MYDTELVYALGMLLGFSMGVMVERYMPGILKRKKNNLDDEAPSHEYEEYRDDMPLPPSKPLCFDCNNELKSGEAGYCYSCLSKD